MLRAILVQEGILINTLGRPGLIAPVSAADDVVLADLCDVQRILEGAGHELGVGVFAAPPGVGLPPHLNATTDESLPSQQRRGYIGTEAQMMNPPGHSNECEMIYMTCYPLNPTDPIRISVLAHELEHLIHWGGDINEDTWVDEGLAELAMVYFGIPDPISQFNTNPDNSLNTAVIGNKFFNLN